MDPAQKQAIMVAILAFNFTFIVFTVVFNSLLFPFSWIRIPLGLLIAAGAAAGGYFACKMTQ
jgi:hypothetical protein